MSKLSEIQQELHCPKNQNNDFGGYKYRSCGDILQAVKPLLGDWHLIINDEMVEVGGRVYVKATVTLELSANVVVEGQTPIFQSTGFAREALTKKGQDESQITGAASSYARKYALNGLFAIDDTKDADATNDHGRAPQRKQAPKVQAKSAQKPDLDLNNAKASFAAWVQEQRPATIYDTPHATFMGKLWAANYGKEALTDLFQLENLRIQIKGGKINLETGELNGDI